MKTKQKPPGRSFYFSHIQICYIILLQKHKKVKQTAKNCENIIEK